MTYVLQIFMIAWLSLSGIVMQQSLDAWSDPNDYKEALYVHAPDGACGVSLNRDTHVITIDLCEI